jgi:hypothetical protein
MRRELELYEESRKKEEEEIKKNREKEIQRQKYLEKQKDKLDYLRVKRID